MEKKKKTIESKVAETILQRQQEITIGDKTYKIAPPSLATLILVSEAISYLPQVQLNKERVAEETLFIAKDCKVLGDVLAILVLGAKGIEEVKYSRPWWCPFIRRKKVINHKAELAKYIVENFSPALLSTTIYSLVSNLQLGDFFGLTTFLIEVNLMRPKKVENETTASGQ